MIKINKLYALCFWVFLGLSACFHETEEGDWKGDYTSSGYPLVKGRYDMIIENHIKTCTDGSEIESPEDLFKFRIEQDENELTFFDDENAKDFIVDTQEADHSAAIRKNGDFIFTGSSEGTIDGLIGSLITDMTITGSFSENSWSGIVKYKQILSAYLVSCTGETEFSGDKLN